MISRRACLAVGGTVALSGCLASHPPEVEVTVDRRDDPRSEYVSAISAEQATTPSENPSSLIRLRVEFDSQSGIRELKIFDEEGTRIAQTSPDPGSHQTSSLLLRWQDDRVALFFDTPAEIESGNTVYLALLDEYEAVLDRIPLDISWS